MIHGQKKVEKNRSEEQLKEETQLSSKINNKLGEFFKIRNQPIQKTNIDKLIQFTTILMQLCPDITTIYNYRRELIQTVLDGAQTPLEKVKTIGGQIKLITKIIQDDPKSYTLWSYRQWLVVALFKLDETIIMKEKQLCKMLLMKDEKNFHVWNYRSWANSISMNIDDEMTFTKEKITSNPFNFSPYHFRSKHILKKYAPFTTDPQIIKYGMPKQVFDVELQMVKTAMFLNPKEQAPWLYYSWILKQIVPALFLKKQGNKILFSLKVQNIDDLMENGVKVHSQISPSSEWEIEKEEKFQIYSNEDKQSSAKLQTTGRRVIGTKKSDLTEIMKIFETEYQYVMEVIESQENKCRFGWLQLLQINKNILYLGSTQNQWEEKVKNSLRVFENLEEETKGSKYIQKQKLYWKRLEEGELTEIERCLKNYHE